MSSPKVIFGFHAVGVRIKTAPQSVIEVLFDASRRHARMKEFMEMKDSPFDGKRMIFGGFEVLVDL